MNKYFGIVLLVLVVVASCKKKEEIKKEDLAGTWEAYRYFSGYVDRTTKFHTDHPGWYIKFDQGGTFEEAYIDSFMTDTAGLPDTLFNMIKGTWTFIDNEKVRLEDTIYPIREYIMFNLTTTHVQFRTDTNQIYLSKIQ